MMRFDRPAKPAGFTSKVKAAKDAVQALIDNGQTPSSTDFADAWGQFKPHFAEAQHNKCGYCELEVIAGQPGDVEHYRPKAIITRLLARGTEQMNSASVKGRKVKEVSAVGFWWLAYDWDNYLLSCRTCNSPWKVNLFPFDEANPVVPPTEATPNTALLLNPFGPEDPIDHFMFDTIGAIAPRDDSKFARATIDVCGLDRKALTQRRSKLAKRVHRKAQQLVDELNATPPDSKAVGRLAEDLVELGDLTEVHCGMVRTIVRDYLDVPWSEIESLVP